MYPLLPKPIPTSRYIILEHAANKTLFDLFHSQSSFLPTSLVTHFFSQLMHGLAHLHSLHIVHRDIKLENVFLFGPDVKDVLQLDSTQTRNHKYKHFLPNSKHSPAHTRNVPLSSFTDLSLKLGDFGLAHTHSPPTALSTVFHGSPHYQAPELWARVPHCPFPTDLWSAGVVLFALVVRRLPFGVRELEEWGCVFNEDHCDELHVENKDEHEEVPGKERVGCPIPRAGSPLHMPYDSLGIIPPAIDNLLQRLFALDPAVRPTALEALAEPLFSGAECSSSHEDMSVLQGSKDRVDGRLVPPQHIQADTYDSHDLYDLATLCTPPSTHVPRATFHGSSLKQRVRKRLESGEECIEKVWAGRLKRWAAWEGEKGMGVEDKETGVLGKQKEKEKEKGVEERRVEWEDRKAWGKNIGRIMGADIRGHLANLGNLGHAGPRGKAQGAVAQSEHGDRGETNLSVLKPKVGTSLSFRSLRIRTVHKPSEAKNSRPTTHAIFPLDSAVTSDNDATPRYQFSKPKVSFHALRIKTSDPTDIHPSAQVPHSLVQTSFPSTLQTPLSQSRPLRHDTATVRSRHETVLALQSRHDALLRRAYELGFGTQDLRAFADEAGRIVRDAREGSLIGDKVNVDSGTTIGRSSSMPKTFVFQNRGAGQKCSVRADMPVVKVVAMGVGRPESCLNVAVDVSFDVDLEKDSRWI